jgi:arsenate reductase
MADKPAVLFVCVHNAGRSQMAAAWLRHLAGDRVAVRSAGSEPAAQVNPLAVEAMGELGIDMADLEDTADLADPADLADLADMADLAGGRPKKLTAEVVQASDVVITMGCGDACPVFPGKRYEDWALEDPAGKDITVVRRVRDEIRTRVDRLVTELLGE